jgi:hypothetical protein
VRRTEIIVAMCFLSMCVLGAIAVPAPSLAGGICMDKLVGATAVAPGFDCNVEFSNGTSEAECWTPSTMFRSQFFDILTETLNSPVMELPDYGCACDTTGSFKSPKFQSSADKFECDDDEGDQLQGTVKGKKISGQGSDSMGNAFIFSCTPNTGCG